MYNAEQDVSENINMLKRQTYENFHCVLVDDISTDRSVEVAIDAVAGDARFSVIRNQEKKYKVRNVVEALSFIEPSDEDVILIVDGDDKLASDDVLQTLQQIYQQKNALLTYGSYMDANGQRSVICQQYAERIIEKNRFRKAKWHASHLKTFKFKLFKKIRREDLTISSAELTATVNKALLRGRFKAWYQWRKIKLAELLEPSGQYIRRMDDKVLFYPMLEMAGDRGLFIEDILYVYSGQYVKDTVTAQKVKIIPGDHKSKWYGRLIRQVLQNKPAYSRLSPEF